MISHKTFIHRVPLVAFYIQNKHNSLYENNWQYCYKFDHNQYLLAHDNQFTRRRVFAFLQAVQLISDTYRLWSIKTMPLALLQLYKMIH